MSKTRFVLLIVALLAIGLPPLATAQEPVAAPPVPDLPVLGMMVAFPLQQMGPMEFDANRQGHDYKDFDLAADDPQLCRDACRGDPACKAWTYVKPNAGQGFAPRCWLKNAVPAKKSDTCCVSGVRASAQPPIVDWNFDRPGNDYKKFDLPADDPLLCLNACAGEPQCKAWTYVKPNSTQGFAPRCWLKDTVPARVADACCASGVKGAAPPPPSDVEWNTNRQGQDYKDFDLPNDNPMLCRNACLDDANCRAWTYVKPNAGQGFQPRCWLKDGIPAPAADACCVSGVKPPPPPKMDWNTDRPGSDYKDFDLPAADPQLCQNACAGDAACKAWAYVKPNSGQGFAPRCWLKDAVPAPVDNNCCVTGVK
jgi:hypothetical protein